VEKELVATQHSSIKGHFHFA